MAKDMKSGNLTNGTLSSLRFISLLPQLQQAGFAESLGLAARERQTKESVDGKLLRQGTDGAEHTKL